MQQAGVVVRQVASDKFVHFMELVFDNRSSKDHHTILCHRIKLSYRNIYIPVVTHSIQVPIANVLSSMPYSLQPFPLVLST